MGSTSTHLFFFTLCILSFWVFEAEALRCFHCTYFTPIVDDDSDETEKGHGSAISLPLATDPSCAYGKVPDPSMSIDCSVHPHIVAATVSGVLQQLEELNIKIDGYLTDSENMTYSCAAMQFSEEIEIGGSFKQIQSTYRSCYPDTRNITEDLYTYKFLFGATNFSGYTCEKEDNCNGKGDKKVESAKGNSAGASFGLVCVIVFLQTFWGAL